MSSKDKNNDPEQTPEVEEKLETAQDSVTGQDGTVEENDAATEGGEDSVEDAEFVDIAEDGSEADAEADEDDASDEDVTEAEASEDAAEDADADVEADETAAEDAEDAPEEEASEEAPEDTLQAEDIPAEDAQEPVAEVAADAAPEPAPQPTPAPAPAAEPAKSGGGFMPAVLGGLVAAGLGFGAATYLGQQPSDEPNPLEASLAAQDERLSGLETKIGEIAAAVTASDGASADAMNAQLSALTEQLQGQFGQVASQLEAIVGTVGGVESSLSGAIGNVQSGLGDVGGRLAAIDERLTAVEKRPLQESSETAKAAFAAYERELEELKQTLSQAHALNDEVNQEMSARAEATQAEMAEVTAQAEALQAEAEARAAEAAAQAEAKANAAAAREALASLDGALERGTGYATPLAILAAITEVPEALSGAADGGVTSLPELRRAYPEQARAALDASIRNTVADDASGRIMAFLRTQSGVRSLAPRDGDDPDAVLSRAEAALNAADLETTLAELAQLPPAGQEAMADWVAQAQQRLEVTQAASALATTLLAN